MQRSADDIFVPAKKQKKSFALLYEIIPHDGMSIFLNKQCSYILCYN